MFFQVKHGILFKPGDFPAKKTQKNPGNLWLCVVFSFPRKTTKNTYKTYGFSNFFWFPPGLLLTPNQGVTVPVFSKRPSWRTWWCPRDPTSPMGWEGCWGNGVLPVVDLFTRFICLFVYYVCLFVDVLPEFVFLVASFFFGEF